jgi:gas vesicle protein
MARTSKILLGLLGAAAAGVAIGLLIAPDRGTETRKRVQRTASDWYDSLGNLLSNAKGELEEVKGKVKHGKTVAEHKVNKLKESFS